MRTHRKFAALLLLTLMIFTLATTALAAEVPAAEAAEVTEEAVETAGTTNAKAYAAALAIGLSAAGGAIAMGMAASKAVESISRQPEAESKIRTTLMLGLVFIETAIIYALLVVILIIFVL